MDLRRGVFVDSKLESAMYAVATMAIDKGKLMGIFVDVTLVIAICYICAKFSCCKYDQSGGMKFLYMIHESCTNVPCVSL
jgi:hypothetical protein